jgi:hypothetical protein
MVLKIFYGRRKNPKYMVSYPFYVSQTRTDPNTESGSSSSHKTLKDALIQAKWVQDMLKRNNHGIIPITHLDFDDSKGVGLKG